MSNTTGYSLPYLKSVVAEHGPGAAICPWCDYTWAHSSPSSPSNSVPDVCPACGNDNGIVYELPYHIEVIEGAA